MQDKKDELDLNWCDIETIPCQNCKWAHMFGFAKVTSKSCAQYQEKPDNVYYESASCPKFEKY